MMNRLKELREAAGMSQADVAKRIGTTAVTVGRYEKEPGRITLPLLDQLARALNCTPIQIISGGTVAEGHYSVALHIRGGDRIMLFDRALIASLGEPQNFAACEIGDDAMEPTLPLGGICVVDITETEIERDGLYLIEARGHEVVRRVFIQMDGSLRVAGDHAAYKDGMIARPADLKVTGRVVWGGRRF